MKILHTGDLHLDSAYSRYGVEESARLRGREQRILRRIFRTASEERCDMILIAGDLFDSRVVTPETAELFCFFVRGFDGPVVVSPGNHDPYEPGSLYAKEDLPDNLYVFNSRELQRFDFPELNAAVYGYAFLSAALSERPLLKAAAPETDGGEIRLLCAHGDLSDPLSKYAPITDGDLAKFGFAYAALGHVHNRAGSFGVAQYCGFPQGRSFDEPGEGGVMLVTVKNGETRIRRKVISEIEYWESELDVSGAESAEELEARLESFAREFGPKAAITHLRLTLCGMLADGLVGELRLRGCAAGKRFASLTLRDETVPSVGGDYLARDNSIRGAFYRTLEPALRSDLPEERERAVRALRIGLLAIEGKSFTDPDRREEGGEDA